MEKEVYASELRAMTLAQEVLRLKKENKALRRSENIHSGRKDNSSDDI